MTGGDIDETVERAGRASRAFGHAAPAAQCIDPNEGDSRGLENRCINKDLVH